MIVLTVAALVAAGCGGAPTSGGQRAALTLERFISGPQNAADYKAIWGKVPGAGQQQRDQSVLAGLSSDITRLAPAAGNTAADTFTASLKSSDAAVVTVIGHNDGGFLRLADGSGVPLSELGGVGPLVAMISCDAARYASNNAVGILPSTVTLSVAVQIERTLTSRLQQLNSRPDVAQLKQLLDESTRSVLEPDPNYWGYALAVTGTGTAGTATVRIWQVYQE